MRTVLIAANSGFKSGLILTPCRQERSHDQRPDHDPVTDRHRAAYERHVFARQASRGLPVNNNDETNEQFDDCASTSQSMRFEAVVGVVLLILALGIMWLAAAAQ